MRPLLVEHCLFASLAALVASTAACRVVANRPASAGIPWPPYTDAVEREVACSAPPSDPERTILGIRAGKDAVDSAQRILGPSPLRSEGSGGEHVKWRCWRAANGDGTVLYAFRGDVEGGMRILGSEMSFAGRDSCPTSKLVQRSVATAAGFHLDLLRREAEAKMGSPSEVGPDWGLRGCCARRPMIREEMERIHVHPPEMDVCSVFRVVYAAGKVVGFGITVSETF